MTDLFWVVIECYGQLLKVLLKVHVQNVVVNVSIVYWSLLGIVLLGTLVISNCNQVSENC